MDAQYERYYFVSWSNSRIVDYNAFYKQLKALLPSETEVYGVRECHVDPSETEVVQYHVLLAFPFVRLRERRRKEIRKWVSPTSVAQNLVMVVQQKNLVTEQCEEVSDTVYISIQCPRRQLGSMSAECEYEDLPKWFEQCQSYIEKDGPIRVFGHRIDPQRVCEALFLSTRESRVLF
jgi:hypothetical protein